MPFLDQLTCENVYVSSVEMQESSSSSTQVNLSATLNIPREYLDAAMSGGALNLGDMTGGRRGTAVPFAPNLLQAYEGISRLAPDMIIPEVSDGAQRTYDGGADKSTRTVMLSSSSAVTTSDNLPVQTIMCLGPPDARSDGGESIFPPVLKLSKSTDADSYTNPMLTKALSLAAEEVQQKVLEMQANGSFEAAANLAATANQMKKDGKKLFRKTCHRCGNVRKNIVDCSVCLQVYCAACAAKYEAHSTVGFKFKQGSGCPVCLSLCCCSNPKGSTCRYLFHCYRRCEMSRFKSNSSRGKKRNRNVSILAKFSNEPTGGVRMNLAATVSRTETEEDVPTLCDHTMHTNTSASISHTAECIKTDETKSDQKSKDFLSLLAAAASMLEDS